ncbi:hypothetical protein ACSW8S_19265 (plasmid) [Clostridium perfringens]
MAVFPLDVANRDSVKNEEQDVFLNLIQKNWIKVLNESAVKILIYYTYKKKEGQTLMGNYNQIMTDVGLSKGGVSSGILELEAFGFLRVLSTRRTTKIYDLNDRVLYLNDNWIKFLSTKTNKAFCLDALAGKDIKFEIIEKMQCLLANSREEYLNRTLKRLLFLFTEKKGFTINDLLEEELTKMEEEILFASHFGFGDQSDNNDIENWESILTDEEKSDKKLMEIVRHYVAVVNFPTRADINYIKKAMEKCYPYQIKIGITASKAHPKYGHKFNTFGYIYRSIIEGRYGTREKNNLKQDFAKEKKRNKATNQTDKGFKNVNKSRNELNEYLDRQCSNSSDEAFDFGSLRG